MIFETYDQGCKYLNTCTRLNIYTPGFWGLRFEKSVPNFEMIYLGGGLVLLPSFSGEW